jgi:tRNA pseudouridine38-40 synthase
MPRYKITIEYDGTGLVGWQRQDNGESVQGTIERAIEAFSGEKATLFGAGRTDAGVHARGQVAHFDIEKSFPTHNVLNAINFHVRPIAIAVVEAEEVTDEFHARFSAKERSYIYRIINRPAPLVLDGRYALHIPKELDHQAMHDAAQVLVGKHDFSSFRAKECQSESPVKSLTRIAVTRDEDEIQIAVAAPSFLHHMVRNITGTLIEVGNGKWTKKDVQEILTAKDRAKAGPTAPAHGLYFMKVVY